MQVKPLLRTSGLTVRFAGLVAVSDVTMSVQAGSINGVIGPNGAGKSTFFNAVSGLVSASSGRIFLDEEDITDRPPHTRAAAGIQRTFQSVQLLKRMTVLENILVGLHSGIRAVPPLARIAAGQDGTRDAIARAEEVAKACSLGDVLHKEIEALTFKQQRFVEIARALACRPVLLMLDEPAAGLSGPEIAELEELLLSLPSRMSTTVLLVEHVISLVMKVCSQITVLEAGQVIASGPAQEVGRDERVIKAYFGEAMHA
jgi:ABC-type branched-subunit amino acid transport system ATPase component